MASSRSEAFRSETAHGAAAPGSSFVPRSILITGGAGFIGSHVVRHFVEKYPDYRITVLDKLDYCASMRNLEAVRSHPRFSFVKGDVLSIDLVRYLLESKRIDSVMHFAAQTHVDASFGNSLAFTMNNTYGTHVLLEACRSYGKVERFVLVSTDEVYGETSPEGDVGGRVSGLGRRIAETNLASSGRGGQANGASAVERGNERAGGRERISAGAEADGRERFPLDAEGALRSTRAAPIAPDQVAADGTPSDGTPSDETSSAPRQRCSIDGRSLQPPCASTLAHRPPPVGPLSLPSTPNAPPAEAARGLRVSPPRVSLSASLADAHPSTRPPQPPFPAASSSASLRASPPAPSSPVPRPVAETSRLVPTNPYAAAKAGAEMVATAYYASYGLPLIIGRGNNAYGPGQFPEKLIPKFATLATMGRPLPVHGDGLARRSYLHVADVAHAYDVILHRGVVGEIYNIGSKRERTVMDVARDILHSFHLPLTRARRVRDRPFNDQRYCIDDAKLAALGWEERVSWEEGLRETLAWYQRQGADGWWREDDVRRALRAHPNDEQDHVEEDEEERRNEESNDAAWLARRQAQGTR